MSRYADQQSLMTVVPGSIQSRRTAINVSAVPSGTGTRNVFSDSRLTPPNTHCPFTLCPLLYLRRPNLLSSISTVMLGPPISWEQPSTFQHDLCTEFGPISDGCRTELMLLLDCVSRNAANDVVREENNLYKVQFTLLKPSTVTNWGWSTACGSGNGPQTSPSVAVLNTRVNAPGHL